MGHPLPQLAPSLVEVLPRLCRPGRALGCWRTEHCDQRYAFCTRVDEVWNNRTRKRVLSAECTRKGRGNLQFAPVGSNPARANQGGTHSDQLIADYQQA